LFLLLNPGLISTVIPSFAAGGVVSKMDPDSVGAHPDWRKALGDVLYQQVWKEGDSASVIEEARLRLKAKLDILSGLGRGTYFNEASSGFLTFHTRHL
jgi:hypothetical protein